jgi:hypothetical protein
MKSLTRETFKIYYKYARQQAGSFVIGWLFLFFYMAADVYRPTLFKRLFDGIAALIFTHGSVFGVDIRYQQ